MDITPEELKERLSKNEKFNIIDVREPWEHDEVNITGAINIPLGMLPQHLKDLEKWKEQEIIVHCRSGVRSANAKKYLEQQGFKNVKNLLKGIEGYLKL